MRPFVEFVQQSMLPWQTGFQQDTWARILSTDPENGSSSQIVQYPPGWSAPGARVLGAAEELIVLAGEIELNGIAYSRFCYSRMPEGSTLRHSASAQGALVLTFYNKDPHSSPPVTVDERKRVERIDCLRVPASPLRTPNFPLIATRIDLYDDPDTGDATWILASGSLNSNEHAEKHPVVEEMLLLAGEMHGNVGVMQPGAYFWRPPEEWHGPYGSVSGAVCFFRTQGGPLSTEYTKEPTGFEWNPEYKPILPERYLEDECVSDYEDEPFALWDPHASISR